MMSPSEGRPPVIGLLGGIAAGKTTVARMLADLGATCICADETAHTVLERPDIRERIVARWGQGAVGADQTVDRAFLAERVFADREELAALEAITHPAIVASIRDQIARVRGSADVAAVVVDAPLLVETELDGLCDVLILVDCPREVRLARAAERGWGPGELDCRERRQQALDAKRQRARFTIEGDVPLETTFQQVQQLWLEVLGL